MRLKLFHTREFPTAEDHARLWRIAGPMILTGLTTPMLGLVDTFVMGHLDAAYYLGAVGVGAALIQMLFWSAGFLRMSTTALAAQTSHDSAAVQGVLQRALVMAAVLSLGVLLLREPIQNFSYAVLALEHEVDVHSRLYFEIRIWSTPAVFLNFVIWGWCLGMRNARAPLYLAIWINVLNMILDVVLVFYFGLETRGVAYASLIAEYSGLLPGGFILWRMLRPLPKAPTTGLWHRQAWGNLFAVNHHLFVRTVLLLFAFTFFMAQSAKFGATVLAANAVLMNFLHIIAYGMDGFAHGLEVLCGRAVGIRDRKLFWRVIETAVFWCAVGGALMILTFAVAGQFIIEALTELADVQQVAAVYLPWLVIAPLFCLLPFLLDGLFIGTTRTREMRNAMVVSIGVYLLLWWGTGIWENHGLWLTMLGFMVARSVTLGYYGVRIERSDGFVPEKST